MPELPEVETIRRDLEKKILNKTILTVKVNLKRTVKNNVKDFLSCLTNNQFTKIERRGKLMIFQLKKNKKFLLIHLRMTGQLIYKNNLKTIAGGHSDNTSIKVLPNNWTRVEFSFKNGGRLFFNDMRTFGFLKLVDRTELEIIKSKFGWEPFGSDFKIKKFKEVIKSRKRNIKAFLLDQKYIAGLGNIYVDEVLFRAGVRPTRKTDKLKIVEIEKIFKSIRPILRKAIKMRGTTFNDYVDSDGNKGGMSEKLQVFGRNGKACRKCGKVIQKEKIVGRGSHFCVKCQK